MDKDLLAAVWICQKVCTSDKYAQNLYAAMCNNDFIRNEVIPILKEEIWSCSWRSAGGIVADMREKGDYLDWYCSGINCCFVSDEDGNKGYVPESMVADEIKRDLLKLGWIVVENIDNEH
jgi:hypothetical protein